MKDHRNDYEAHSDFVDTIATIERVRARERLALAPGRGHRLTGWRRVLRAIVRVLT